MATLGRTFSAASSLGRRAIARREINAMPAHPQRRRMRFVSAWCPLDPHESGCTSALLFEDGFQRFNAKIDLCSGYWFEARRLSVALERLSINFEVGRGSTFDQHLQVINFLASQYDAGN